MEYQELRNNFRPKHDIQGYHGRIYQCQRVPVILNTFTNNLTSSILVIIVLVLLLSCIASSRKIILTLERKTKSKKIPKAKLLLPVTVPVLDSIYNMIKFRKDGLELLERLTEQYGNLFEGSFGPIQLTIVSDPVIIQKLLGSSQGTYLNRPKIYHSVLKDVYHNGLLISENEIWSAQRKMLARSFTYKSLQNYVGFMNTHAANLTSKLIQECEDTEGIEAQRISQLLCCHSFKIIAQIVMGTDSISPDESNEVAENFNCFKDLASERLLNPWKYLWFLPKRLEYDRCHKYLNKFFVKMTQKYKKEYKRTQITSSAHKSLHLGTDCDSEDERVGVKPFRCMIEEMLCSGASDQEIYQQVGTILGTGHDTTTVAIRMLILHLALNLDHQVKCREEVDQVINEKGCTNETVPFDLLMEDLNDLKYLERCILESGRLTSVIPIFLRRIDAPLKINNELEFPAGTNFVIANWTLHRDPKIYPDPLKFDPDRFLSENVKKRHPYSYTAFSMGPRNCIGSKVAIMQIKVIMAHILHHFEIFSEDKLENVKIHFGLTLVPEREYNIVLKPREHSNL